MRFRSQRRQAEAVCIGIDLSLTATGLVAIPSDWMGRWDRCVTMHVTPDIDPGDPHWEVNRLQWVSNAVVRFVQANAYLGRRVRVGIENYAHDRKYGMAKTAEVGGLTKVELHRAGYPCQPIMMQSARKLAVGVVPRKRPGNMKAKDFIRAKLTTMGMPPRWSMDVGDAWVIANYLAADHEAALITPEESKAKTPRRRKVA